MSTISEKQREREAAVEKQQAEVDKKTRKVALVVAFVSVFYFFIKLLFL